VDVQAFNEQRDVKVPYRVSRGLLIRELKAPIIHQAGFAVRLLYIDLSDLGVMADHIQAAVFTQANQVGCRP